jgi:vitamin B12 transporter
MKKSIRLRARAFAPALSVLSLAVVASVQAQGIEVNPVVISASRMEQPLSDVLSSVSVITRADIDKSQAASLADLLQGEAGFEFGRNGGPGATTSLFLRGQDSINTVVLIDGVRAQTDKIGAIQTTDFPLQQIERVEILKGNASALYGNGAIGGVVNIVTRQNKGAPKAYGSVSAGSYKTTGAFVGYGGTLDDVNFDLNAGRDKSAGFSAMNATQNAYVNPDRDGYQRDYASAKFEKRISADTQIGTRLNYSVLNVDYDRGYSTDLPTDLHKFKRSNQSVSGYVRQAVNENWVSNVSLTRSEYKYDDTKNGVAWPSGGWDNSYFRGWQNALAWNNTYQLQPQTKAVFGADLNNDTFNGSGSQNSAYALTRHSQGYFAGLTHQINRLTVQANVRHDQLHLQQEGSSFQSDNQANTGLLGLGYQLTPLWKLTGTLSTGFSAPTADATSSNSTIKPEHHHSQEVGAVYQTNETLLRAVYFQTKATDAIIYNISSDSYQNSDIDNKGVELTARANVAGYSVKSSVTLQDSRDIGQNLPQARRAKQYGALDVSRTLSGYEVGSRLYAAAARRDSNYSTGYDLAGYSTLALYVSRKIDNELTARVKLENAFDRQYQLASGYNTPGRGIYASLQYQPK